jgi:prenyltransferase beta subunit
MNELYLGYTLLEYAFMMTYLSLIVLVIYSYVRINDLKEQRDYYQYLQSLQNKRGARQ